MSISEKRLKAIAGGEPFFPGEVVAMLLSFWRILKKHCSRNIQKSSPARSFLNPASGLAKASALTWYCGRFRTALNVTLNWMLWGRRHAQNMMLLLLNFGKSWDLVRQLRRPSK